MTEAQETRTFASWDEMELIHAKERAEQAMLMYRMGLRARTLADPMSIRAIHEKIALKYGIPSDVLRGKGRVQALCDARHEAWYIQHKQAGKSLPQIGAFYANRDHTTVLGGVRRHAEKLGVSL